MAFTDVNFQRLLKKARILKDKLEYTISFVYNIVE